MATQSPSKQDPLSRLRRRIQQAQRPSTDRGPTDRTHADEDDPLATLRRRIDEASEPSNLFDPPASAAPPPLSDLLEAFDHAEALLDEPVGYVHEVDADDPLERMRRHIERAADAIGRREAIPVPRQTSAAMAASDETPAPSGDATAAVGREVLRMLAERDLPGSARAEAVRRLAAAIESGDQQELRDVLRLLIQG